MYHKSLKNKEKIFAVAPMMDWTDRHCRLFHRQLTGKALLYTEMVVADALIFGDPHRHLDLSADEQPVALQLGGSDPGKLAKAAEMGAQWGYMEINLNVGCPSDRVQSGVFGACLMEQPGLVADCVAAMKDVVEIPVTVKCRIGVDEQDPEPALQNMAQAVFAAGCDALWVHARKAWLKGLSPKENRDIPPLNYDRVYRLKQDYPNRFIGINGGITGLAETKNHLSHVDGVMLGRAAYQNPAILHDIDSEIYGVAQNHLTDEELCQCMMAYAKNHIASGGRLHHVTRHMIGYFQGRPGARRFRQILSVEASKAGSDERVIEQAFDAVPAEPRRAA